MRKVLMFVFAMCLALFAVSAMAQTATTGAIEGTVTDPQGNAVPNATVTVSGSNLISAQSATTDDQGRYRVGNLPPGKYEVTVAATSGFAETKRSEMVEVNLDKVSTGNVQVAIKGQEASVTVTGTAGAGIDVTSNTSGSNVTSDQFSNFPTQRTVQGLYTIAPTVSPSGLKDASGRDRDPSVGGASGPENNYILDGVNTTDPAFGGSGANLPFEFIQEVEIKTGSYSAEYGRATGGIFNVITKSGSNEIRGDAFAYFTTKGMVREVKNFPFTGAAPSGFSEIDAGVDIGGPIIKDKLWFFGAFNPHRRENEYLTQTFLLPVENKVTTPFYAGKLTWGLNSNNTLTLSTFGDFTKQEGFLFRVNARVPDNGFGANLDSFRGTIETGGHNYTARLNSTITPTWIGEFMFGLHLQRANTIPVASVANTALNLDNFAVARAGAVVPVTLTATPRTAGNLNSLIISFVDGRNGGSLVRNYTRDGFGLVSDQDRNRWEGAARLQNIYGRHTIKYGFEFAENQYKIFTRSSGAGRTYTDPTGEEAGAPFPATNMPGGVRVTNNFGVCVAVSATAAQCPTATITTTFQRLIDTATGPAGITSVSVNGGLTAAQLSVNPILISTSYRTRDFLLNTGSDKTTTRMQGFYIQDEFKITKDVQFNFGLRWDYQQAYGTNTTYIKLNNFKDNLQPRVGLIWDFTGQGRGKLFVNYARVLETPIPLDVNVRAGGDDIQLDRNANVNRYGAPTGSAIIAGTASGLGCLGCEATPIDPDLKPQTNNEVTAGIEYELVRDLTVGFRGIYRTQGSVIEDGSFNDGATYFLFNPGESLTERIACSDPTIGCFGRARRYYRALEFTATKRFSHNYQFIASYVYSSLIGNYEGLFRNDNGQSDPNITSLFDLPSLNVNLYGRLPNDRPHQLKFNSSYRTPWKFLVSANFYMQSGIPFNAQIPHPVYGNDEGFAVQRGTAIIPADAPGGVSAGANRSPTTFQLDLGGYYPIKMGEHRELRFTADWFNVTNAQRATRLDSTLRINSGISGAQGIQFANPFYGTGLNYQFPSALRLGAKFSF
ncbi:MAG TPA: TonB-dependent receptor [Pyrinomonadaceae bacterium]|nr:TonB-dependent receptor [Pyrinomonadaceae bacterium]